MGDERLEEADWRRQEGAGQTAVVGREKRRVRRPAGGGVVGGRIIKVNLEFMQTNQSKPKEFRNKF